MTGTAIALCAALSIEQNGEAPEWVHLLPAGAVRTVDGRGPYSQADPAALIAASMARGKLPLDENHAYDRAAKHGHPSPARGWITELQSRADGIWGRVEWVDPAAAVWRGYRGISPAVLHDAAKRIVAIPRASLVNDPNLQGLIALHSKEDYTMDFRTLLIELLKLDSGADDAAIAAALRAMTEKDTSVALQSALSPIAALVGVAATADAGAVLAGVQRLKDGAGDENETILALQGELADVTTRFNTHVDNTTRKEATDYVDAAIAAGRVGVKPQRDRYIALHMSDAATATAIIGSLPSVKAGATVTGEPERGTDGLTAADREVIQLMGLDAAEYAKTLGEQKLEVL